MTKGLLGWGRYPRTPQSSRDIAWRDDIPRGIADANHPTLAFGNGRSYGDSCHAVSGQVLHMKALDRVISADWNTGIIRAEAGMTLGDILDLCVPQGWFVPVTPGTKFVTLGGAVANDVHGKNHHRSGTFGRHVRAMALQRSDTALLSCTPDENTELFQATIGGLGLTGIIAWVELQLMPVKSSAVDTVTLRFDNLASFFELSDRFDGTHEYGVAWVDCLARGRNLGRGIYIAGQHAVSRGPSHVPRRSLNIPFDPILPLINGMTTRIFNPLYWRAAPRRELERTVHYDPYFYPLDRIHNWNRLYGRHGFQQFQCVIPEDRAESGIALLLQTVAQSGLASFLTVLKRCGDIPSPGMLSFPLRGTSLAIDFAQSSGLETGLLPALDRIVHENGGRLYPAKDAHMTARHFQAAYPAWRKIEELHDPALMSAFWKRVTA